MDKEQEEQINEELDRALSNPKVKDFIIALGNLWVASLNYILSNLIIYKHILSDKRKVIISAGQNGI